MSLLEEFADLVAGPDGAIPLDRAALLIAKARYPELNVESQLRLLDGLARGSADVMGEDREALYACNALSQFLFDEAGFRGNDEDYYDPRNSYLNDVLDRRTGIPISLSLLYMEVGRRLGIALAGIGMPGHFLVRHQEVEDLYIDPFHGGILLSQEEAAGRLQQVTGGRMQWRPEHLGPVSHRAFLARMLRNLKGIYLQRQEYDHALGVLDLLVALLPGDETERRDRQAVLNRQAGHP